MAIIDFLSAGEPTLALPNVSLSLVFLDDCHPPIEENKYHGANAPLDEYPDQEQPTKQDKPQTTMFAFNIG